MWLKHFTTELKSVNTSCFVLNTSLLRFSGLRNVVSSEILGQINCSFTPKLYLVLYWTIKSASLFSKLTSLQLSSTGHIRCGWSGAAGWPGPGQAGLGTGAGTKPRVSGARPQSLPGQCRHCFSVQMVTNKWQVGQNWPPCMHSGCHSSVHWEQTSFHCANVVIARIFVKKYQAAASDAKHRWC